MILEIENGLGFGLGFRVQQWPKARHVILRVGRIESRVILTEGGRSVVSVGLLLLSGIFAGR